MYTWLRVHKQLYIDRQLNLHLSFTGNRGRMRGGGSFTNGHTVFRLPELGNEEATLAKVEEVLPGTS